MSISNNDRDRGSGSEVNQVLFQGDEIGTEKGEDLDRLNQPVSEESSKVSVFTAIDSAAFGDINHLLFLLY